MANRSGGTVRSCSGEFDLAHHLRSRIRAAERGKRARLITRTSNGISPSHVLGPITNVEWQSKRGTLMAELPSVTPEDCVSIVFVPASGNKGLQFACAQFEVEFSRGTQAIRRLASAAIERAKGPSEYAATVDCKLALALAAKTAASTASTNEGDAVKAVRNQLKAAADAFGSESEQSNERNGKLGKLVGIFRNKHKHLPSHLQEWAIGLYMLARSPTTGGALSSLSSPSSPSLRFGRQALRSAIISCPWRLALLAFWPKLFTRSSGDADFKQVAPVDLAVDPIGAAVVDTGLTIGIWLSKEAHESDETAANRIAEQIAGMHRMEPLVVHSRGADARAQETLRSLMPLSHSPRHEQSAFLPWMDSSTLEQHARSAFFATGEPGPWEWASSLAVDLCHPSGEV